MPLTRRLLAGSFQTILAFAILILAVTLTFSADLQDDTAKAYDRYIEATEARMARERESPETFLHIETLPAAAQRQIWAALKRGEVWVYPLATEDAGGEEIRAPHGTITHWAGDAFFAGESIDQVLSVILDFDHLPNIYKPEIVRSRLVDRQGGIYRASVRMHKDTPWVNPTFNVDWLGSVLRLDPKHASCRMVSTRIAQVENAGQPDEHEDSVGRDGGYLWRLNTYWRLEERDGGVVGEWEAVTLSRDIPFLLRWLVRPFVDRLARQTIRDTLIATRNEAAKRRKSARADRMPSQNVALEGRH